MSQQEQRVFNGRYELIRHIARGGMAEVWQAHDLHLDRPVALKILFPELSVDPTFVERFRREAQAAANLGHPNIVSIYDWGAEQGTYFIVMEYVDGRSLSSLIRGEGRLLPDRAAAIGADVAAALAFAHKHGVVHRDVKPANVLIDSSGHVKVTDFGIARAKNTTDNLTQTGAVMGTATYFSPEQAQGATVDNRSDVYSLGVVLFEMTTGRPPFSGDNPMAIAYKHVKEQVPAPSSIEPTIPPAFEAVVLHALVKDPDQRYASADELRADLIRYRQGRPVQAVALGRNVPPGPPVGAAAQATGGRTAVAPAIASTTVQDAYAAGGPATMASPATRAQEMDYEEPPRRTAIYVVLLVAMLAALAILLTLLYREFSPNGGGASTVVIPADLIGKTSDDAKAQLVGLGFTNITVNSALNDQVEVNKVFKVDPDPGSKVAKNAAITLTVSAGANPVTVPEVTGKPQDVAEAALAQAGFKVDVQSAKSDTVAAGNVISQSPPGNSQAPKNATVVIVVSTGKTAVFVPDVTGKSLAQAVADLTNAKFKVDPNEISESSDTVAQGKVTRTDPPANTAVAEGATIKIFVSSGPKPTTTTVPQVQVPDDLVGLLRSDATTQLTDLGFKVSVKRTCAIALPANQEVVKSVSPDGGTDAPKGSTVTLTVEPKNPNPACDGTTTTSTTKP